MNFDLDKELKQALGCEAPSPDFTDRVMARVAALPIEKKPNELVPNELMQEKKREKTGWLQVLKGYFQLPDLTMAQMKWAIAGAIACLLIFAGIGLNSFLRYREHQRALNEMAEGEKAKEQVMLAMKIASAKLNVAQKKVQESSER